MVMREIILYQDDKKYHFITLCSNWPRAALPFSRTLISSVFIAPSRNIQENQPRTYIREGSERICSILHNISLLLSYIYSSLVFQEYRCRVIFLNTILIHSVLMPIASRKRSWPGTSLHNYTIKRHRYG